MQILDAHSILGKAKQLACLVPNVSQLSATLGSAARHQWPVLFCWMEHLIMMRG
jgi:hypothetical protein